MKVFTVYTRRHGLDPDRDIVFVKEGFCWPAFFFSVLWALWCRLWLVALGFFAAEAVANAVMAWVHADLRSQLAVSVGLAVIVGLVANDLHRWTLERRGFILHDIITGGDGDAAERRFFDRHPELTAEHAS
jgi:hypothetical protein